MTIIDKKEVVAFPVGLRITAIRYMTQQEKENEGWEYYCDDSIPVLVLSDGSFIYPSADPEGNGPGMLFGLTKDQNGEDTSCYIVPLEDIQRGHI